MIRSKQYSKHVLDLEPETDALYRVGAVKSAVVQDGDANFVASFVKQGEKGTDDEQGRLSDTSEEGAAFIRVRLYGDSIVRFMMSFDDRPFVDQSPMLAWHPSLRQRPCQIDERDGAWSLSDGRATRFAIDAGAHMLPSVFPDGVTGVQFQGDAHFFLDPALWDALPLCAVTRQRGNKGLGLALTIEPDEHFCGTGERFDRMDLFGRQIDLLNDDAFGANSRRAYKNIPFLMSSRSYGLFAHSSAKMRLDIGRHSTQALQWFVEDDVLDMFFIGGGSLEEILLNYRKITGFPSMTPLWSFGAWMSRMTYTSAEQMEGIADRLRAEEYPMDVLHEDTAWFPEDWKVDWSFSEERFPDPPGFFARMREKGFRVTLWQWPHVQRDVKLTHLARERGYVGQIDGLPTKPDFGDTIDLTNPDAVKWYKGLLRNVLEAGAAAIKADFGEWVDEAASYKSIDAAKYRNLFSLLYQQAVWEVTQETKGYGMIWARSAWAGSQRYPVHWGGDAACSYHGMAGSLCGGLHLGLSGFAFWSHDIPGFFGVDEFLDAKPPQDLYIRWIQFGTFSSHMRFHGTAPREPWEYPSVKDIARQWLRFRYALIPYIVSESEKCCKTGLPMLRALVIGWNDDPTVWGISNQYMFGDAFLVCPVLEASGKRDVYLPEGRWVDFWTGRMIAGPAWLKRLESPLSRLPLYVRWNATVEFVEPVQCTDELPQARRFSIVFDDTYRGFDESELAEVLAWNPA